MVALQANLPPEVPASQKDAMVLISAVLLLIKLPANGLGKAAKDGPNSQASAPMFHT